MTEQESREKIADIIYHTGCTGACCECDYSKVSDADTYCKALLKADALIGEGLIFDKTKAILAERANSKTLIQKAQYYDQMKHRAEVAEKALYNACRISAAIPTKEFVSARVDCFLKQAEKELQTERRGGSMPTHWCISWSGTVELGFDDGTYLPRRAAVLLYPEYFDEKNNPILSMLPMDKGDVQ